MPARNVHLALAMGALCTAPAVLLVRRVADAHRRRSALAIAAPSQEQTVDPGRDPLPHSASRRAAVIDGPVDGLDPSRARREHGRYVVDLPAGRVATLTVDPAAQRAIATLIAGYQIPRAAVVVLDTDTGRVRVYVSQGEPGAGDLVRDATPPAASVFKIVTASALVPRGVGEQTVTCYSGGFHALRAQDLVPDARRDRECVTLGAAFGRSINTVFARRALERLAPGDLAAVARAWGLGQAIPFDAPVGLSAIDVPTDTLGFARTAAGFWHSHLSPLHAAMIAQAIARGGELSRPYVVESIADAQGVVEARGGARPWVRAVSAHVAAQLGRLMTYSVSEGTAQHAFHDAAGRAYLPEVTVTGKTGTLTAAQPFRAYTWFVGNATDATTRVSFAVMVANGPVWRVRAATLARQALQVVYRGRATD